MPERATSLKTEAAQLTQLLAHKPQFQHDLPCHLAEVVCSGPMIGQKDVIMHCCCTQFLIE
jgi:hypothetical protein